MKSRIFGLLFLVFAICACSVAAPVRSPVSIITDTDSETVALMDADDPDDPQVFCTGVWVAANEILTANHCANHAADLALSMETLGSPGVYRTQTDATLRSFVVFAVDPEHDLALLVSSPRHPSHVNAHVGSVPVVGDHLWFVGHPAGFSWTHVEGTAAAWRTELNVEFKGPFLQVAAPVWFGNSGGGAFNARGELVGVASFISRAPNMAFYIPTPSIQAFLRAAHGG